MLVNLPCRGMVGAARSGAETCSRHAPQDYAAIHFHADDLNDCGGDTDFSFAPPPGLRGGCYMLHLSCADDEDWCRSTCSPRARGRMRPSASLPPRSPTSPTPTTRAAT